MPSDEELTAAVNAFDESPWQRYEAMRAALDAAAAVRAWTEVSVPRDDAIGVVAALAATISIIERTPQARKAAMSDKAFGMMLADYTKALAKGRAMLSASGGNRDDHNS